MRTHKFRLYEAGQAPLQHLRDLLTELMMGNFPPSPDGKFEVWVDRGLLGPEDLERLPGLVVHEVDPFPYGTGYPERPGQVPEDAFPVNAGAIKLAVFALRCWWNETAQVVLRRPQKPNPAADAARAAGIERDLSEDG